MIKVKKLICVLLSTVLVLMSTINIYGISEGQRLIELELMEDSDDLQEYSWMRRGELAKLVCEYMKVDVELIEKTETSYYSDIDSDNPYYKYVNYLCEEGIMVGNGNSLFSPDGIVTEEMVATVLLRVLGYEPEWGSAVPMFRSMSGDIYGWDLYHVEKRHVYTYFYRALGIFMRNSTETLSKNLGYQNEEYILYGAYRGEYDQTEYTDIEGNKIDSDELFTPVTGTRYIYEQQKNFNYALIDEDGSMIFGGEHVKINTFDNNQEGICLIHNNEYIMLDSELNIIEEGVVPKIEGMYPVEITDHTIMYFSGDQYYELYDWEGELLIGNEKLNASSSFFLIDSLDDKRFVRVTYIDKITEVQKDIIYDVIQQKIVIGPLSNIYSMEFQGDYFMYKAFIKSNDEEGLPSTVIGNLYGIGNITTGEVTEIIAKNVNDREYSFMGEYIAYKNEGVIEFLDYDLNTVSVLDTDSVTYLNWGYYKTNENEIIRIIDVYGNVLIEDFFGEYGYDKERGQIYADYYEYIYYYDKELKLVSKNTGSIPGAHYYEVKYLCANGNYVAVANGKYILQNTMGETLFDAGWGSYLMYNYQMDYIIHFNGEQYELLDSSGELINGMSGYTRMDFVGNEYIEVYDGEKTFLVNKNLEMTFEPIIGNVHFSTYWKYNSVSDLRLIAPKLLISRETVGLSN